MSNTKPEENTAFVFILALALPTGIAYWLGGQGWAIGIFVLLVLGFISMALENRKASKSNADKHRKVPNKPQSYSTASNSASETSSHYERKRKVIDEIQFEYRPADGSQGVYTVQVYKGIRGNLEGYCHERDDVRTFRPDRIINNEVVRTATGEVMSLKEWRALFTKKKEPA